MWKALHFLLVCFNENFKNQSFIDVQLIQQLSIISKKVHGIVKTNPNPLKNTSEYVHY